MRRNDVLTILGIFVTMLLYAGVLQTAKVGCFILWGCLILGTGLDLIERFWSPVFKNKIVGDLIVWAFFLVLLVKIHAGVWLYLLLALEIWCEWTRASLPKDIAELVFSAALDLGILNTIHAGAILYSLLLLKWILVSVISGSFLLSLKQIENQKNIPKKHSQSNG